MPQTDHSTKYPRLDAHSRHLLQVFALLDESTSRQDLAAISKNSGWADTSGKAPSKTTVSQTITKLLKQDFLLKGSYGGARINPRIQDLAVQDALHDDWFSMICRAITNWAAKSYYRREQPQRDLRIAFYKGDVEKVQNLLRNQTLGQSVRVLDPFNRKIFEGLDPALQEIYLADRVPRLIIDPRDDSPEILAAFDEWIDIQTCPGNDLLAAWLDLAIARGDLESLQRLDQETVQKEKAVAGCAALLRGDLELARAGLGSAFLVGKRKTLLGSIGHLPAVLFLLLLLERNSADALNDAKSIVSSATKARKGCYTKVIPLVNLALAFRETPSSPVEFAQNLKALCRTPLETLLAGYFGNWLLTEEDTAFRVTNLVQIAKAYQDIGLDWLAAEASGLAGKSPLKSAATQAKKSQAIHARLGTASLVELIEPEPVWQQSLSAIAQLAKGDSSPVQASSGSERIIWEMTPTHWDHSLEAYHQVRKGQSWSKGRKVARKRLYEQFNEPAFAFLAEEDRALCRALEMFSERNYYGYAETYYQFHNARAARALIGHPRIFPVGNRANPYEIVEQQPKLTVLKEDDGRIRLALDPKPPFREEGVQMVQEGPHRLAIVFFHRQHMKLHDILGGELKVPASAAQRVMEAIGPVASLVTVQSEIGGEGGGQRVEADPKPHVHLLPYQEGLRVEFFVRPFGEEGPYCHPGQGGANVFATRDQQSFSAKRDLDEEKNRLRDVTAACSEILTRLDEDYSACFSTPVEALEALIQLEDLQQEQQLVMHWPQGQRLKLAGRASESQLRVHIRKDRDWFAASGDLTVDPSLSLDMMKLIELVEASPARFVKLDDGRFLALTQQLRQRIEELAAYGDRRSKQHKLRFPRVRAAVLEDWGESVQLKSDKHWQDWIRRMREAADVRPEVPSTLQTGLRDYQVDGFLWLARLAAWGVGGCLADDMGLGKTIQALALLLDRASGGPALVVAPTSVAFNWLNEVHQFAPTLNAYLFGTGDRAALMKNLKPRDLVICSYGLLHTEAKRLQGQAWHTVILDEAQAIKNMATLRSQAAMGLEADFRLIMTGTPLENHLGELWNLFQFINPGLLGSWESFQERFAGPIERDGDRETRRRLKKLIQPFLLRRTKSQVLEELPPKTEVTLQVELSEEESAFYEALRQRAILKLAEANKSGPKHLQILAEIMKLRRACCHPRLVLEESQIPGSKLALFSETLDELLDNNHKVLVFSQFVGHLSILREELDRKQIPYQYLDGSTPARKRKQSVEAFQAGQGDVFLISLKAGGLGLNLTAADYVVHMDPWWNPAVEDQASDRAHRLGQQRPVTIYRFITKGTIEERITKLHAQKRDLAESLLEGADLSGKLSTEDLLKLIRE